MALSRAQAGAGNAPVLSDVLQNYRIDKYTSFDEFVAPTFVNNGQLHGKIPVGDTEGLREEASSHHRIGQKANMRGTGEREYVDYMLEPHSLRFSRDSETDAELRNAGFDPDAEEMALAEDTALKLHILKHRALYTKVATTGNYDASLVNAIATAWSNTAGADPETDVRTLLREIWELRGIVARFGCLNWKSMALLKQSAGIRAILSDLKTRIPTEDDIRQIFELDQLLVTDLQYDGGRTGDAADVGPVWGNTMLLFDRPVNPNPSASLREVQFMRTIRPEPFTAYEITEEDLSETRAPKGGSYIEYTVHQGYWSHELISQNDATNKQSICAGILTGIY